jgi:transcriptional regulator with XRE-family HTH domain
MTQPQRPRFYLAEWIAVLDITDEILAERSGVSRTHITQLKNDQKVWNERVLLKLAKGLGLRDPLALFRPPNAGERTDIWDRIPAARRRLASETVTRVLEGFAEGERAEVAEGGDDGRKRKRPRKPKKS